MEKEEIGLNYPLSKEKEVGILKTGVMNMEQELKEILISMQSELKAMKEAQEQTNVRLDKVDCRLDAIEGRLDVIEEDTQVTREAVNTLLEWAEKAQVEVKIPLLKKAE